MSELLHTTRILQIQQVTHDVKRFVCVRPTQFEFREGQAVEVSIANKGWEDKSRPFTLTSVPTDGVMEFVIKIYKSHDGVTRQLDKLNVGADLLISNPFGAIEYKGSGIFIAGGAGVTPFISILRSYHHDENRVIFSNKTPQDVILGAELELLSNGKLTNVFTEKAPTGDNCQRIDKSYLSESIDNFDQQFYVCGPPVFTKDINSHLEELGANAASISLEK
tara:strand:+ start:272 stop:934 length:663 start_codon:yes stop_codon:yes gene_type:complete